MNKVLLFSTDPGGANTIIPLVPALEEKGYTVLLFGHDTALDRYLKRGLKGMNIFDRISKVAVTDLIEFLRDEKPNFIITSTSSDDNIDKYIWKASEMLGIKSFAILDQWVNYKIRFSKYIIAEQEKFDNDNTIDFLPTKIIVMDDFAREEMLIEGIPESRIVVAGQPHFEYLMSKKETVDEIKKKEFFERINFTQGDLLILFISENITKSCHEIEPGDYYWGYTEKTICINLIQSLIEFVQVDSIRKRNIKLLIKQHPKEDIGNFDDIVNEAKKYLNIMIIQDEDIFLLLECVDIVVGMSSMFLLEASLLGKPVISVQIGLKRENPLVLDRMGLTKTVLTQEELNDVIENGLGNGNFNQHIVNFKNSHLGATDRIIKLLEDELCINLQ